MKPQPQQPDPAARLISHAVVGAIVGYALGRKSGLAGFLFFAIVSAYAHEQFDAPVAKVLAELDI